MAAGSIPAYGYLLQAFTLMKFNPLPPLEEVRKYLDYDPETGDIVWINPTYRLPRSGTAAGSPATSGHIRIRFSGTSYAAHRLAWLLHTGEDPGDMQIDHIDRDRANNRFSNLRLATNKSNTDNQEALGYFFHKRSGKWLAQVTHWGKNIYLGLYDCPLLARLAYEDKKRELCGEFSPV